MKSIIHIQKNRDLVVILLLLVIFAISSLLVLDFFPKVWMDEAWDSTTAYSFQKDGTFRNLTLVSTKMGNQDIHFLQPRILSNIVMAPFYAFLGVGSVQGRLASVLVGLLAVIGVYLLARKIGNHVFSFVCALFFIFDNLFFVVTRTIRPEIFVVTLDIWALLLVLGTGTDRRKLFSCGLILGVSLYAHPNAFLGFVAILILALYQSNKKKLIQVLFTVGFGIIIGFLPYAIYVGYQDGANHFHDFWLQIQERARMLTDTTTFLSGALTDELQRYASYIFFPYRLPIFLIQLLAIGYATYQIRDRNNQVFLIFLLVHIVLFPILISAKTPRYLTVLMPVVTILVMKMLWGIAGWSYDVPLQKMLPSLSALNGSVLLSAALAFMLFINYLGGDAWAVWSSRTCSFPPFVSKVRSLVPAGARVWGPMTFWFGFYDYPYRTQWTVDNDEEFNNFKPEYVILYDNAEIWAEQTGVTKRPDPNYARMEYVRDLVTSLVEIQGVPVGTVPNLCYGNIEVFKLNWK